MRGTLAVVSQSGQSLSFFDLSSGERTAYMTDLIAEPHELCFDKARRLLYVTHTYHHGHFLAHGAYSREISVIDPMKKETIDVINISPAGGPHGIFIDENRDILYASVEELPNGAGGGLIGIDLKTRRVCKQIRSEAKSHWFTMTPDGKKAYTCNKSAPFISILDLEKGRMIGKIPVTGCEEPSISSDGKFAYFPTPDVQFGPPPPNARIEIVDTTTDKIVGSIPLDLSVVPIHVTSTGTIMAGKQSFGVGKSPTDLVSNAGRLALYDPITYKLIKEIEVGATPLTIRSTSDGLVGFVANLLSGTVSVIDLVTNTVVRTIVVDTKTPDKGHFHQGAHGMAFIP